MIESSYGLGEAIVLGKVTPDRFVLDKRTLQVLERADFRQGRGHLHACARRPGSRRRGRTAPR